MAARELNNLYFSGVMTRLGIPSTRPPQGSDGRRTVIPVELARKTLDQLPGLPVNLSDDLSDHQKRQVVGHLLEGRIQGDALVVRGRLYDRNYGELAVVLQANQGALGMSYECTDCAIEDTNAPVWTLSGLRWTGCSILKRTNAAYQGTSIALAAGWARVA